MNKQTTVKVCGLTSVQDIETAQRLGADYFGVIIYPNSPRAVSLQQAATLAAAIPPGRSVLVNVAPNTDELARHRDLGFAHYQIHCDLNAGLDSVADWSELVGRDPLWLAPRIPPTEPFPQAVTEFATTILIDAFHRDRYGGTGETGDWQRFAGWKTAFPAHQLILAGGLNPTNVLDALIASQSDFIDVNSGVESAPGIKDPQKLQQLFAALS